MGTADKREKDDRNAEPAQSGGRRNLRLALALAAAALLVFALVQAMNGNGAERERWCEAYRASYAKFPDPRLAALRAEYLTGLRLSADACD